MAESGQRGAAMKSIRTGAIMLVGAMAVSWAGPAFACSPPAPPPQAPAPPGGTSEADIKALSQAWNQAYWTRASEERRAWSMKQQAELFDKATRIAVARFDHAGKTSGAPPQFDYMNGQPLAVLKPVRWVKGQGASGDLQLAMGQLPPCGQMAAHDAFYGKPGDVFLIYFSGETLLQSDVLDGFALDRIIEPRTLAALTKAGE
jgi:hypothetical protein